MTATLGFQLIGEKSHECGDETVELFGVPALAGLSRAGCLKAGHQTKDGSWVANFPFAQALEP
jgi:hypothetical protein